MANHIHIFCASPEQLSMRSVGQYMATIGLLDGVPTFDPPLESAEALDPLWVHLSVTYQAGKRPIQLHRMFEPEDMAPALQDALTMLDDHGLASQHPEIVQAIQGTRQIFHFELGLELPDDCWEMLDALEAHIAKSLKGLVFTSEGFYDAELEPICMFG